MHVLHRLHTFCDALFRSARYTSLSWPIKHFPNIYLEALSRGAPLGLRGALIGAWASSLSTLGAALGEMAMSTL